MKKETKREAVCPKCGKKYHGYPALSRRDNQTFICPDCGTREALADMGVEEEERERIIGIIHANAAGETASAS